MLCSCREPFLELVFRNVPELASAATAACVALPDVDMLTATLSFSQLDGPLRRPATHWQPGRRRELLPGASRPPWCGCRFVRRSAGCCRLRATGRCLQI